MDIIEALRQGAYTDALDDKLMKAAANEIEVLRAALRSARIQLAALGGTAGVHMSDEDARELGCDMIQRAVIITIDEALKE